MRPGPFAAPLRAFSDTVAVVGRSAWSAASRHWCCRVSPGSRPPPCTAAPTPFPPTGCPTSSSPVRSGRGAAGTIRTRGPSSCCGGATCGPAPPTPWRAGCGCGRRPVGPRLRCSGCGRRGGRRARGSTGGAWQRSGSSRRLFSATPEVATPRRRRASPTSCETATRSAGPFLRCGG